jgi:hypothetical protein
LASPSRAFSEFEELYRSEYPGLAVAL